MGTCVLGEELTFRARAEFRPGLARGTEYDSVQTVTKSAAYTIGEDDDVILVTGTTTITLPAPSTEIDRSDYTIKRTGTDTVTIATADSATIDGSSSITLDAQYASITVVSDGTNWHIMIEAGTITRVP